MGRFSALAFVPATLASATVLAHPRDRIAFEASGHRATWEPIHDALAAGSELSRFGTTDDDHAERAELRASYAISSAPTMGVRMAAFSTQVLHGDWSSTAATSSTQRLGMALEASTALTSWLVIDGSVSCAQARFAANAVAQGATSISPRAISALSAKAVRGDSFVSLRARGLTAHADSEDGLLVAEGRALWDLSAGTRRGNWDIAVTVENLLDSDWLEAPSADFTELASGTPLTAKALLSYAY